MAAFLLTFQHLRAERESALRDAAHEVGMRATIIVANELNAALQSAPKVSPPKCFAGFSTPIPSSGCRRRC